MGAIQQLADIIAFARKDKNWTRREVSTVAGCPERLVQDWEEGKAVPDGKRWNKLCRALDRSLYQWNSLHRSALIELEMQDNAKPATTNLGEKLREAVEQRQAIPLLKALPPPDPEPEPSPDPHQSVEAEDPEEKRVIGMKVSAALKALPEGWKAHAAIKQREDYAREVFRQRPRAHIAGPDGVMAILRAKFGVAVNQARLAEIKEEVQQEALKDLEARKVAPVEVAMAYGTPAPEAVIQAPPPVVLPPKPATVEDQLSAAVEMLRDAIPHLSELLLIVNEAGEVDVSYKVREVKVVETGGSLKLGGRK